MKRRNKGDPLEKYLKRSAPSFYAAADAFAKAAEKRGFMFEPGDMDEINKARALRKQSQ